VNDPNTALTVRPPGRSARGRSGPGMMRRLAQRWRRLPRPVRRAGAALAGGAVIAAGLVMLVIPGPGLVTVALGVAILAAEFSWPRRLLHRAAARLPGRWGLAARFSRRWSTPPGA
jgi:UPF0716 family protein affecting phage T7 exclusion